MASGEPLVFLFDCDNTLLDNDALKDCLAGEVAMLLGIEGAARFWQTYEAVRAERDVVDLPLTAARYGAAAGDPGATAALERIYDGLPFERFVYPHAVDAVRHVAEQGAVGILSDGDAVFQPLKIERSGLGAAVGGNVLIYAHKEAHLDAVAARWPGRRFVLVDDKARILAAVKALWRERVTTVHVLQGHYAREPLPPGFSPDVTLAAIGDLRSLAL